MERIRGTRETLEDKNDSSRFFSFRPATNDHTRESGKMEQWDCLQRVGVKSLLPHPLTP
jgi:hypothetical protein